jgi:hypothetical protein
VDRKNSQRVRRPEVARPSGIGARAIDRHRPDRPLIGNELKRDLILQWPVPLINDRDYRRREAEAT